MPRTGNVYSEPAGTKGIPNTTIQSVTYNAFVDDIVAEQNGARPIQSGGTAATNATQARINLGTNLAGNVTSGVFAVARIPHIGAPDTNGTARLSTFLDGSSAVGGADIGVSGSNFNFFYNFDGTTVWRVDTTGQLITGIVPVARITGLGSLATKSTINDGDWSGTDLAIINGGTGASTPAAARANLGTGLVANGGTGGTDPASARAGIGAISTADMDNRLQTYPFGTPNPTSFRIVYADTAGSGDLFKMTQASFASLVSTLASVNNVNWSGTDLAIINGGTGASTPAAARSNLNLDTFTSSALTPTLGGLVQAAHGLGADPPYYAAFLRCSTAEFGWSVGDEIAIDASANGTATGYGVQVYADATNVYGRIGNGGPGLIFHKTTGAMNVATNANWRVILKARL